ncbi:hypothetical protein IOM41_003190 [Salmonella enterica]|nr:hypothetical protein [Salmonella enterica]
MNIITKIKARTDNPRGLFCQSTDKRQQQQTINRAARRKNSRIVAGAFDFPVGGIT